ncbi:MAG: putative lipoprotein, partial [Pseudomonas sp.]|nr:putative lipoprotein [Pseudomonas sp.]
MKPLASRYLLLVAFSVLLGACQSTPTVETSVAETRPDGFAQLEQSITSNELATA